MVIEEQENEISIDIPQFISYYNLYKQGRDLLTQLKPLNEGLNILQKIFSTITDSYHV